MKSPEGMIRQEIRDLPQSGIRKYFDLINEMTDVISLGIGEPDFVTPWRIREAGIYSLEQGHTHYTANAGMVEFRKEVSRYLKRKYDVEYDYKNEIIATAGASEAIDLALKAVVGKGDEVILPEPSFVAYAGCVVSCGGKVVSLPLKQEDRFRIDPMELEKRITEKTKAVIIPYPNNPTGAVLEEDDLTRIVEVLEKKDVIIISDEIYSELVYGFKFRSMATYPGIRDRLLLVNGLSKTFAMTGWRLGYICGPGELIRHIFKIHQYALMCAPTSAQYAGLEALRSCDDEVENMRMEYDRRRKFILEGIRSAGLECFEPQGAFYIFPGIKSTGMTSDEFCEGLLKTEKVLVVPGSAFGESGEGYVRATYASSMDNIKKALEGIKRFVSGVRERKID